MGLERNHATSAADVVGEDPEFSQEQNQTRISRAKALAIFAGREEGLDHFGVYIVPVELIQFGQPEVVALVIKRWFWWVVRISLQITEVLHEHESFIEEFVRD